MILRHGGDGPTPLILFRKGLDRTRFGAVQENYAVVNLGGVPLFEASLHVAFIEPRRRTGPPCREDIDVELRGIAIRDFARLANLQRPGMLDLVERIDGRG